MKGIDDIILNKTSHIRRWIVNPQPFEPYYKVYKAKSDKAVFLYHGWAQGVNPFKYVVQKLKGKYNIVLFFYPMEIICDKPNYTPMYFDKMLKLSKKAIKKLEKEGVKEFYSFGVSLGTFLSVYIANKTKKLSKMVLSIGGNSTSETFWDSITFRSLKNKIIKKGYTLPKLKKEWSKIEPHYNLENIKNKKILIYNSTTDQLVRFKHQDKLTKELKKNNKVTVKKFNVGHYFTGLKSVTDHKTFLSFYEND